MKQILLHKTMFIGLKMMLLISLLLFLTGCNSKEFVCSDGSIVNDPAECGSIAVQNTGQSGDNLDATEGQVYPRDEVDAPIKNDNKLNPLQLDQDLLDGQIPDEEKPSVNGLTKQQIQSLDLKLQKDDVVMEHTLMSSPITIGEKYVFPFAFKNPKNTPYEFTIRLLQLDSRTMSNSQAGADDTVLRWSNIDQFDTFYTLQKNEKIYLPLEFIIGKTINENGKATVPGTYKFMLDIESRLVGNQIWNDYGEVLFYVRVE